jgi:hypothetical protein
MVSPFFRCGPESGEGCSAPSAFWPARGRPNRDLATRPRFVALVGLALVVFLQRIQAEVW